MNKTLGQIAHDAGKFDRQWQHMGESQKADWERIAQAVVDAQQVAAPELLAAWLQWCLDNCDDSPEYNFGTTATEHMRALLAGNPAPMPTTQGSKP